MKSWRSFRVPWLLACLVLLASPVTGSARAAAASDSHDDSFRKYSKRFFGPGFDWRLFKAQGMTESNLDMSARSRAGALGIMQLMPSTFLEVQSKNPDFKQINDAELNIASGICYDRKLYTLWNVQAVDADRCRFMFGSYNAGRATLLRAQELARSRSLDPSAWPSIRSVAPDVPGWRHEETLNYILRIESSLERMDDAGRIRTDTGHH